MIPGSTDLLKSTGPVALYSGKAVRQAMDNQVKELSSPQPIPEDTMALHSPQESHTFLEVDAADEPLF